MKTLRAIPLTAAAFAPFGDVVSAASAQIKKQINAGHTTRFHDLAHVASQDGGRVTVNIFRSDFCGMPVIIHQMERHPKSSQLFMPLGPHPYLVIVSHSGKFNMDDLRAFIAQPDQGVNYHAGTWHHYSLALQGQSDFLVVDYVDLGKDCDTIDLPQPLQITL
ncbi:MAG: ureidoglycolate lyase [Emcibacter sp.]|nr:ureidoglycolate lyase [Emcibacter sp.]